MLVRHPVHGQRTLQGAWNIQYGELGSRPFHPVSGTGTVPRHMTRTSTVGPEHFMYVVQSHQLPIQCMRYEVYNVVQSSPTHHALTFPSAFMSCRTTARDVVMAMTNPLNVMRLGATYDGKNVTSHRQNLFNTRDSRTELPWHLYS